MRFLVIATLVLFAAPAFAAEPETVILPVPIVSAILNHLSGEPWKDVVGLIAPLQACIAAQVPDAKGVIVSHDDCPAVTAALAAKPSEHPKP